MDPRREPPKRWADFPGTVLEELESKKKKETAVVENRLRDTGWGRGRRGRDDWREKHGDLRRPLPSSRGKVMLILGPVRS